MLVIGRRGRYKHLPAAPPLGPAESSESRKGGEKTVAAEAPESAPNRAVATTGKTTAAVSIFSRSTISRSRMSERPLSPHLQVYRLPVTAVLSITHRISGVILSIGMVFWAVFLVAVSQGESAYGFLQALLGSLPGRILLWGWIYALFFHLCHGVRHLVWDLGYGLERETLGRYAYWELAGSVGLTLGLAAAVYLWG
jgi:succinate dehydrogenase / fumarate reductase cytochrome b subunit